MRPDSVTSTLVDRQVQRWYAAQASQRNAQSPPSCNQPGNLAQTRLSTSPFLSLRSLQCEARNGHVTIRGRVPTRYLRDLSAMLVRSIDGVLRVTNEVEVLPLGRANACK
jgi:osmotically-inducible protein OsmY